MSRDELSCTLPPHLPAIRTRIRGRYWSATIDDTSLCDPLVVTQAQLVMAYTVAAQLLPSTDPRHGFYAEVVADIVRYVNRDLSHPAGGFFSAEVG
jgi:hypothetical protein